MKNRKKFAVLFLCLFFVLLLLLWLLWPKKEQVPDPFVRLRSPFTCSVVADIEGFVFGFDVSKNQSNLKVTLTSPSSLEGLGATLDTTGFQLFKGDLIFSQSGEHTPTPGIEGLIIALFGSSDFTLSQNRDHVIATGKDENGNFELIFDRQNLFPISLSYKNAKITAQITNFKSQSD